MKGFLDEVVYGAGWATADSRGTRVELYGPLAWALTPAEQRDFPWRDLMRVRRRMRPLVSDLTRVLIATGGLGVLTTIGFLIATGSLGRGPITLAIGLVVLVLIMALGAFIVIGIPVEPVTFRRAMLAEGRCPCCAQPLAFESPDGEATCGECGSTWKREVGAVARSGGSEWSAFDARGAVVALFDATGFGRSAADRLDMTKAEVEEIVRESVGSTRTRGRTGASGAIVLSLYFLVPSINAFGDGDIGLAVGLGCVSLMCFTVGAVYFRFSRGLNPDLFRIAMLRRGRCPSCAYRIDTEVPPGETRTCPECGCEWLFANGAGAAALSP